MILTFSLMMRASEKGWAIEPIELSAEAEPKTINVGDEITFEINVKHLPEVQIFLPGTEAKLSPFEVKRYRPLPRSEEGGFVMEGGSYRLTVFELGTYVIPSVTIPYVNYADGGLPLPSSREGSVQETERFARKFVKTQPIPIVVRSLLQEKEETETIPAGTLKESRAPSVVVRLAKRVMVSLAAIGFLCLTLYGFFFFSPKAPVYRPPIPPHRIAEKALKEIERRQRDVTPRELYVQLSEIFRSYLAQRFERLSLHLPTEELVSRVKEEKALSPSLSDLTHFFEQTDLVKFAGHPASAEEWNRFLSLVRHIVGKTTPTEKEKA